MNMEDEPTIYVFTHHFYEVRSSSGLLQATREDIAKVAKDSGEQDVAETILQAYVDDLSGSGDSEEEITKTKPEALLSSKGFNIKDGA